MTALIPGLLPRRTHYRRGKAPDFGAWRGTWRTRHVDIQRIVWAFVGSAYGQFCSRAVSEARDATAKTARDDRDEDVGSR